MAVRVSGADRHVDVRLHCFNSSRQLRIESQEVRDEAKESDGRPETKQRIRSCSTLARRRIDAQGARAGRLMQSNAFAVAPRIRRSKCARRAGAGQGRRSARTPISAASPRSIACTCSSRRSWRAALAARRLKKGNPRRHGVAVRSGISYIFRVRTSEPEHCRTVARTTSRLSGEFEDA